eukprot:982331_1
MRRVRRWIKKVHKWVWLTGTVLLVVIASIIHHGRSGTGEQLDSTLQEPHNTPDDTPAETPCAAPTALNVEVPKDLKQSLLVINCKPGFQYFVSDDSFDLSSSQKLLCSAGIWAPSLKDCDVQTKG